MADTPRAPARSVATWLGYLVMLGLGVGVWLGVRHLGASLSAPAPVDGAPLFGAARAASPHGAVAIVHVLLALAVVIVAARALGLLFRLVHQPPVIGEIVAGIMLGPSLLGRLWPELYAELLPQAVAPHLNVLSQVGVILFMFLVGLELDPKVLRGRGHSTVAISHASIVLPFLLGAGLSLYFYPRLSSSDVPFSCFSLFMGVSMSVTAFPVLARILSDRKMSRSRLGVVALTCAAVDDVTAWCLLALVVAVVQSRVSGAWTTPLLALGFVAVMLLVVRPLMGRLALEYGRRGRLTQGLFAVVVVTLLLAALAGEWIGVHAVFGAFLLGAVIPHDSGLARDLTDKLEDLVVVLLLPAFFAFTGMKTQIGLLATGYDWILCALVVLVASLGKFGGTLVAGRLTGLSWRDASALGVLMNTRGLMELVVLNIGYELGVISPRLFAMLVLMAVITTFATTPILQLLARRRPFLDEEEEAAQRRRQHLKAVGREPEVGQGGVLVPVSNPAGVGPLVDLAVAASRKGDPPPRVLALVRPPAGGVRTNLGGAAQRDAPKSNALAAALERARDAGALVSGEARWTEDPVADILAASDDPAIGWLLLGFHRPVWGSDLLGGVVKDVLERAEKRRVSVGVVVHGHDRPLERIFAAVDLSQNGRAALELATRVAVARRAALHALLVPPRGDSSDVPVELQELLRDALRNLQAAGLWLHSDVLLERTPAQLSFKTPGELVVIGADLVDELGLPLDEASSGERCVVIVQGGTPAAPQPTAAGDPGALRRSA